MWGLGKSLVNVFVLAKHESPCMFGECFRFQHLWSSLNVKAIKSLHSILFISDTISDTLQSFSGGFGKCQDDCNETPDLPIGAELDSKASQLRCKVTPRSHGESRNTHCFQDASRPAYFPRRKWWLIGWSSQDMMIIWCTCDYITIIHNIFMIELCIDLWIHYTARLELL